jgi:hypothetical protein
MDLSQNIVPKSDQLNAEDLLTGPLTVTVAEVRKGSAEQPVVIELVETPGRPFKPSKTVLRVLVKAWGKESSAYIGRRMTLFRDPTVKWAGAAIGGIRVSHLSHIERRFELALTETRGKRVVTTIEPLPEVKGAAKPAQNPDPTTGRDELTEPTQRRMFALLHKLGIEDRDRQIAGISKIIGREIASRTDLTEDDARAVILDLEARTS